MTSVPDTHRVRQCLLIVVAFVLVCAAAAFAVWLGRRPTITLPDGTRIVYHSASRGVPQAGSGNLRIFQHAVPPVPGKKWHDRWQWLRGKFPAPLQARLPVWASPASTFPGWPDTSELELRLRFIGSLQRHQWDICVADEHGWETGVPDYTAVLSDPLAPPGKAGPGWIRLGSPYPRHSKKIRLCFHPNENLKAGITVEEERVVAAELVLDNPFYEGPAPTPGPKPPITKAFRHGKITLEKITRGRLVSGTFDVTNFFGSVLLREVLSQPFRSVARIGVIKLDRIAAHSSYGYDGTRHLTGQKGLCWRFATLPSQPVVFPQSALGLPTLR
jgi:hypothetical protein